MTSPFGPLAVLLDPRAGHGVVAREVAAVEHALEARFKSGAHAGIVVRD